MLPPVNAAAPTLDASPNTKRFHFNVPNYLFLLSSTLMLLAASRSAHMMHAHTYML